MKKRALSLVEILISTTILLAAIVPLWGLMGSSNQQIMRSSDEIMASQITVEILEQIENYVDIDALPKGEDDETLSFNLNSEGAITIKEGITPIKVGSFGDYFMPKLSISSEPQYDNSEDSKLVGRIVTLELEYKSKEGKLSNFILRGYVSAK